MSILKEISSVQLNYSLVVLEDEKTPLAASPGTDYLWPTLAVMALAAVCLILAIYLIRCSGYRRRIRELNTVGAAYLGWALSKLKETVAELEAERVEENFETNGVCMGAAQGS